MDLTLRKINEFDVDDFKLIEKWGNDNEIKYLLRPNFEECEIKDICYKDIIEGFKKNKDKHIYIIEVDGVSIGDISIDNNFLYAINNSKDTSWISICIGEKEYRGRGLSKSIMNKLEELCKEFKTEKIELGVFEYNDIAIKFYKKMGYKEIARLENFVFFNNKWHSDIRMEKIIN